MLWHLIVQYGSQNTQQAIHLRAIHSKARHINPTGNIMTNVSGMPVYGLSKALSSSLRSSPGVAVVGPVSLDWVTSGGIRRLTSARNVVRRVRVARSRGEVASRV